MILGSQSPRRKEILNFFTIPFSQVPSNFDEDLVEFMGDADAYAKELSESKAKSLVDQFPREVIITADTVVFHAGKIFNKPKDKTQAYSFLSELSGQWHEVLTAVCVSLGDICYTKTESTKILFNDVSERQIEQYLSHFAYSDKAGGYAIQQGGGIIVSKIEGCYYNVMGLPINTLAELLKKFNIDLWNHLKIF
ncbi:MAG: septum formation protein Maf [Chlamydiae bacterium]|nr:septum formation protein Maf [Chlamydiota bacterium]